MALIYFYTASELDKTQLSAGLAGTDHRWEYVTDGITPQNCNPDAEVISVFVSDKVTREVIHALPRLRLIACRSTGFDNIDLDVCAERDIAVVNVPTYGEDTVAEYTFALLLALQRRLTPVLAAHADLQAQDLTGYDLHGKTIGVIGTGHIGQKVIKIANGFSMKVVAHDACPNPKLQDVLQFQYVNLKELLQQSDVVTLHIPALPSTRHIINEVRLNTVKPGAILINTARGELVDTTALIKALDSGKLAGAALDVIEGESLLHYRGETELVKQKAPPESLLRHNLEISTLQKMPNVILSPHNAYNTVEAIGRINQTTAQNIIGYWYGNTPNKVVPAKKPYGKLLVVRHAESEWNATGTWTGLTNVHLSAKGFRESVLLGQALKKLDIPVDIAYCSEQIRTRETLEGMLAAAQQLDTPIEVAKALNERDYGQYTGKNKWQMKELIGEEAFNRLRRGWDEPVPGGETLKQVYQRVLPFYTQTVLPQLQNGKNVMLVAHGNSIRALMKYVESISDKDVAKLEMLFGQIIIYEVSPRGLCQSTTTAKIDSPAPNA